MAAPTLRSSKQTTQKYVKTGGMGVSEDRRQIAKHIDCVEYANAGWRGINHCLRFLWVRLASRYPALCRDFVGLRLD